jgi:hypothetical protein
VAVEALAWLAQDSGRLGRFLAICGLGPDNLRQAADEPGFLVAVLDYLSSDESLLIAFAAATQRAPQSVSGARERLRPAEPGGDS